MSDKTISLIRVRAPMRYADGWEMQKIHAAELEQTDAPLAKLILLQHAPVFTLGRATDASHLPISEHDLTARTGADVIRVDRGGSVTYHGPGQLTAYLLLNLQTWGIGVHQHLDMLEESAIRTLSFFGITGHREPKMTGVWVGEPVAKKICAIGVSARRWVTYHGISLNIDMELTHFRQVIPCGLAGKDVTTMAEVLGRGVCVSDVETAMEKAFGEVYGANVEIGMV